MGMNHSSYLLLDSSLQILQDDETDLKQLEANVRSVEMDGLVWGASQFITIGYGIKKLQINLVVEDEKVSIDDLQQTIEAFEEHVQSTDVRSTASKHHFNMLTLPPRLLLCKNSKCSDFLLMGLGTG